MVIIEPIKNQYLTALKERQQIIDKLNEIISGLNALNFDDLTTIQAELVAIRESLQTQNTAITEINNSIGQIETELTSFDNRLITLNTNIEDTKSNLTSFENDTALNLQSKVNKNGDTMTGNLGIPTTETGTRNNLAVNGERLQNDLDNYSQMVRLTGNQKIFNDKKFENVTIENIFKWKTCYGKQTISSDIFMPICILHPSTLSDGYFEAHIMRFGRGIKQTLFRLIWNKNTSLVKDVVLGEVAEQYCIMIDSSNNYYLGVKINLNLSLYHTIFMIRNAGFDAPFTPIWATESLNTSNFTIKEVTQ